MSSELIIKSLRTEPKQLDRFVEYYVRHWNNDAIYRDCMTSCLDSPSPLPQWYLLLNLNNEIIGGAGLITNDFISRMDLMPWLCALYIEEPYRGNNYGSLLIDHISHEAFRLGFDKLYLCTDHMGYYEKFGFEYIGDGFHPRGESSRIYCLELFSPLISLREFQPEDSSVMELAFQQQNWCKPAGQFLRYHEESKRGEIIFLTAYYNSEFAGYVLYRRKSFYPPFINEGIPEIGDLNVLKKFQRHGIGSALMAWTEKRAVNENHDTIGLCVGLISDYGNAQRLYVKRGYLPDGRGLSYNETFLTHGESTVADDDLVIAMTKRLIHSL